MKKYSVCYSDRTGFDWCIVNEFDKAILHGIGNMPTISDIVDAANRWNNNRPTEPNDALAAEVARLKAQVEAMREALTLGIDYLVTIAHDENHIVLQALRAALGGES